MKPLDDHAPFTDYHICRSGRHEWGTAEDALKCCHPAYRRERSGMRIVATPHVWARRPEWDGYDDAWPKCFYPDCDKPSQDGHLTCGWPTCPESEARDRRDAAYDRLTGKPPRGSDTPW